MKLRYQVLLMFFFSFTALSFEWTEVNLGLGLYRYDNIRLENQKTLLKTDPVYEPIPVFQIRVGPFFVNKDGAGIALLYFDKLKLLGFAVYEGEPYKTDGMEERKKSFHLGAGFRLYDLEALYYQDIQSRSRGRVLKITYAPVFGKDEYTFSPRIYTQFWNQKYVDYFFGVRRSEIDESIGRSYYNAKRTVNYGFMLRNIWNMSKVQYLLSTGYKFYGEQVYNSPTVVKKNELRVVLGLMYKFY